MIEKKEFEAAQSLITHNKRYAILYDKLMTHIFNDDNEKDTYEHIIERLEITDQIVETMVSLNEDYRSVIREMENTRNIAHTALKAYAQYYGKELILPEGYIEFDSRFDMQVSIIPTKGKTTVTVEIESNDDNKHNRRRTLYQKIRDGIIFFRQSFRES
jgi:hypothetical protein